MESKLKELVISYVKADAEVESQKSHLADLNRVKNGVVDELSAMIHEAIGVNHETYLDYGDGIILCSDCDGDMSFERIHTIDVDDLKWTLQESQSL